MRALRQDEISISDRSALIQEAFRIEYMTIAWMVIEAAVAADSLTLLAFGIDSLIELASAGVLVWRLTVELQHGQTFAESAERRAAQIGGALLFVLAIYVIAGVGWKLWMQQGAEFSLPGLVISVLAMPTMYFLSRRKLHLAEALGSHALRADAVESITCGWLSLIVVTALVAQLVIGAWWVDAVASLGVVWFLVREADRLGEGMSAAITPHDAWLYMEFFNRGDIRLIQADDREAKTRTGSATCPWSREAG